MEASTAAVRARAALASHRALWRTHTHTTRQSTTLRTKDIPVENANEEGYDGRDATGFGIYHDSAAVNVRAHSCHPESVIVSVIDFPLAPAVPPVLLRPEDVANITT